MNRMVFLGFPVYLFYCGKKVNEYNEPVFIEKKKLRIFFNSQYWLLDIINLFNPKKLRRLNSKVLIYNN